MTKETVSATVDSSVNVVNAVNVVNVVVNAVDLGKEVDLDKMEDVVHQDNLDRSVSVEVVRCLTV